MEFEQDCGRYIEHRSDALRAAMLYCNATLLICEHALYRMHYIYIYIYRLIYTAKVVSVLQRLKIGLKTSI